VPQGEWVIDGAYFYEEMDLDGWGWSNYQYRETLITPPGEEDGQPTWVWDEWQPVPPPWRDSARLLDFETNTWLASLEYGLWENCTIYARAGMANAKAVASHREWEYDEGEGYWDVGTMPVDFDYGFAWQVGSGFTFYRNGPWTFGGRMQFGAASPKSFSRSEREDWSGTVYVDEVQYDVSGYEVDHQTFDFDWWQAVAYLGGTYQVNDQLQLYGGGGWQTLHGTLDHSWNGTTYADMVYDTPEGDLELDPAIPGYQEQERGSMKVKHASAIGVFGVGWQPTDNVTVRGEFLFGERDKLGWGFTAAIGIP